MRDAETVSPSRIATAYPSDTIGEATLPYRSSEWVPLHHRCFWRGDVLGQCWVVLQRADNIIEKLLESAGILQPGFVAGQIDATIDSDPVESVFDLEVTDLRRICLVLIGP